MAIFQLFHKNFANVPFDFEFTSGGMKELLTKGKCKKESEVFQWKEHPDVSTQLQFQLKYKDGVYVWLHTDDNDEDDSSAVADIKHFPAIYYVIKSSSGQMDHVMSVNRLFGWNPVEFLECEDFQLISSSALADPSVTMNDSLVIRVYVEPPAMARRVYSYEGFLSWSLENFSQRNQKEVKGFFEEESPYFYTGPLGYRVRVLLRSMDNVLRVCVLFCAGEFDNDLSASFPHCTTVTLLNRNPERNVVKRVRKNVRDDPFYAIDLRIDEKVEKLIEDDTLFYSVSIRPTILK